MQAALSPSPPCDLYQARESLNPITKLYIGFPYSKEFKGPHMLITLKIYKLAHHIVNSNNFPIITPDHSQVKHWYILFYFLL